MADRKGSATVHLLWLLPGGCSVQVQSPDSRGMGDADTGLATIQDIQHAPNAISPPTGGNPCATLRPPLSALRSPIPALRSPCWPDIGGVLPSWLSAPIAVLGQLETTSFAENCSGPVTTRLGRRAVSRLQVLPISNPDQTDQTDLPLKC
jgi:hypothetical protein